VLLVLTDRLPFVLTPKNKPHKVRLDICQPILLALDEKFSDQEDGCQGTRKKLWCYMLHEV